MLNCFILRKKIRKTKDRQQMKKKNTNLKSKEAQVLDRALGIVAKFRF